MNNLTVTVVWLITNGFQSWPKLHEGLQHHEITIPQSSHWSNNLHHLQICRQPTLMTLI